MTSLELNRARDDRVLGCRVSSEPYANDLHLSLQTDNHTSISSLDFYWPDALPDAQPTVSKHRRQVSVAVSELCGNSEISVFSELVDGNC